MHKKHHSALSMSMAHLDDEISARVYPVDGLLLLTLTLT